MQVNVNFDDDIYGQLLNLAHTRRSTVLEIVRSSVKALCPERQTMLIRSMDSKDDFFIVQSKVIESYLDFGNYWYGIFYLDIKTFNDLGFEPKWIGGYAPEFFIKLDKKHGGIKVTGVSIGAETNEIAITFVGITAFSSNEDSIADSKQTKGRRISDDKNRLYAFMETHEVNKANELGFSGLYVAKINGNRLEPSEEFNTKYWTIILNELKKDGLVKKIGENYYRADKLHLIK